MEFNSQTIPAANAGLCADCTHANRITSDRGSEFIQCQLSFTDPRFAKYPRLPVIACLGYEKQKSRD
jgi:hypothetical protein